MRPSTTAVPSDAGWAAPEGVARLVGIEKAFGSLRAVDGASVDIHAGEIHALLGENGAGKTTLMKMLAGILRPDAGTIELRGSEIVLRDRRAGVRAGIGMVQQHFGLVEELSGAENLVLGHPDTRRITNLRAAAELLRRTGEEVGFEVDPLRRAGDLTVGERQRLEIIIALAAEPAVLIMDEPTAALGAAEAGTLASVLRGLARRGIAVVYITHKLREVMDLSDRVTVMRRGKVVWSSETAETNVDGLAEALIGEVPVKLAAVGDHDVGEAVVALRGVAVEPADGRLGLEEVDLEVRSGEVVGVAGVTGNGQEALAGVLTGMLEPSAGEIRPRPATVAYIPEDRAREGLAPRLPVTDNAIVHRYRDPSLRRAGRLRRGAIARFAADLVERAEVVVPHVRAAAAALSGGNQQRLVLARELERSPDLIVAHNPYRGLDIGAIADVQQRLLAARDRGAGLVVISPDLDDLFSLADRLVVLFEGRIVGDLKTSSATVQELGRLMAGVE